MVSSIEVGRCGQIAISRGEQVSGIPEGNRLGTVVGTRLASDALPGGRTDSDEHE